MTTNKSSVIDHARLEKPRGTSALTQQISTWTRECAAVLEAFDREIGEGTDCDISASIWQEPRENLVRWLGLIREKVAEIQGGMNDDAAWLEEFSRKARAIQDDAATKTQSLGQELGGLGIGGGSPTSSKPSTFDPSRFHDVTPSITVPTRARLRHRRARRRRRGRRATPRRSRRRARPRARTHGGVHAHSAERAARADARATEQRRGDRAHRSDSAGRQRRRDVGVTFCPAPVQVRAVPMSEGVNRG